MLAWRVVAALLPVSRKKAGSRMAFGCDAAAIRGSITYNGKVEELGLGCCGVHDQEGGGWGQRAAVEGNV